MRVGDNIRRYREMHGLTQRELGATVGVSDKAVSTWENGYKEPRTATLIKLAGYFGVPLEELTGTDTPRATAQPDTRLATLFAQWCAGNGVSPEQVSHDLGLLPARVQELAAGHRPTDAEAEQLSQYFRLPLAVVRGEAMPTTSELTNVVPLPPTRTSRRIPVLGRVPAGVPIEAITDIVEEIELTGHAADDGYEYFGLLVTGDSMLPEYRDGDTVILRVQPTAETGDDVVAYIGNSDATLKRLTVTENGLQLRPLNPAYEIRCFSNDEVRTLPVTIAGIVVEQRRIRRR